MVNDIIEELPDLDMEPKSELLWWTNTHQCEVMTTLRVGSRGKCWDLPFREVLEVLGYRYHCDGKNNFIFRSRTVPMFTKCWRVLSHVCSRALNGSINWPWSSAAIDKVGAWEAKMLRLHGWVTGKGQHNYYVTVGGRLVYRC